MTDQLRRAAIRALIPLGYLALALAASWPLARDFATYTVGDVHYDERHAIWVIWHTAQAIAGRLTWPDTTHLLWPHGISVLVDGVGPINGVLALPFWPWGAAAAFNGVAVLGLALSGWCLYALARAAGLERGPAFVAGALYLAWPLHLLSLTGHLEKLFIGLLPLALAAGLFAFDPARRRAWLAAPGVVLLAALLQNGNQFVFAALGLGLLGLLTLYAAPPAERRLRAIRIAWAGVVSILISAPLLLLIVAVMRDPTLAVTLGAQSYYYSADALSLLLPAPHQRWATWLYPDSMHLRDYVWAATIPGLGPTPVWYGGTGLETAVGVPLTVIVLCAIAWRARTARLWIVFGLAFAVLCLGPRLRVGGVDTRLPMPYGVLKRVPGLDVMRTPGRFMFLASAGFAVAAGFGLAALGRRWPSRRGVVYAAASAVILLELAPRAWPQSALPPLPEFYRKIAAGEIPGGPVLDLPHGWYNRNDRASAYMYYQTFHRQPIAWSYLSRYHLAFPNPGLDPLWVKELPAGPDLRARLQGYGFRYLVFHKFSGMFVGGRVDTGMVAQAVGPPTPIASERILREAFAGEAPIYEDPLVVVWPIDPALRRVSAPGPAPASAPPAPSSGAAP